MVFDQKMRKKIAVYVVCLIAFFFVNLAEVNGNALWGDLNPHLPTITIESSGAITPANMPIKKIGDIYYLTDNISYYRFVISRNNTILDGQGFTLLGNMSTDAIGIIPSADNITIQNMIITSFRVGIEPIRSWGGSVAQGPSIRITNNTIFDCNVGIYIVYETNDYVVGNIVKNNAHSGIWVREGYSNKITLNIITNNLRGIYLESTHNNLLWQNKINSNTYGVCFDIQFSGNNTFYQNNFLSNSHQTYQESVPTGPSAQELNNWDSGTFGNFWSDYNGNGSYVIDENNIDHYPLTAPVDIYATPNPTHTLTPPLPNSDRNAPQNELSDWIVILSPLILIAVAFGLTALLLYKRHRKTAK